MQNQDIKRRLNNGGKEIQVNNGGKEIQVTLFKLPFYLVLKNKLIFCIHLKSFIRLLFCAYCLDPRM